MGSSIAVFGSINMDLVVYSQTKPMEGETIFGNSFETFQGGKGANQAVAISKLGGDVTFIGKVGNDIFGQQLKENLINVGVNTDMLYEHEGESGVAFINVFGAESQNQIIVVPGANSHTTSDQISDNLLESVQIIISQLEVPAEEVEKVFLRAKELGCYRILNTAPSIKISKELISLTDLFIMNESELESYSDTLVQASDLNSIIEAINNLSLRDDQSVVVTLGAYGVFIYSKDNQEFIEGHKVEAIDSTGSGDCFVGALANYYLGNRDLVEATKFANKAAALSVTKKGASASMPTMKEVNLVL